METFLSHMRNKVSYLFIYSFIQLALLTSLSLKALQLMCVNAFFFITDKGIHHAKIILNLFTSGMVKRLQV